MIIAFIAPLSSAAQGKPGSAPEQTARFLPGEWELKPLVRVGDAAGETGGRFEEFGRAQWVPAGFLGFWARFGPKQWALYSWKDSEIRVVVAEGEKVQAPHSDDLGEILTIRYSQGNKLPEVIYPGKSLLYVGMPFGPTPGGRSVYGWDGRRLTSVLSRRDTVALGGVPHTIAGAAIVGIGPDGTGLLDYFTDKPRRRHGFALHDGAHLTPLIAEGDELPGMPGVRVKHLPEWAFERERWALPQIVEGAISVGVEVTGAREKWLALRLMPGKAEAVPDFAGNFSLVPQVPMGMGMIGDEVSSARAEPSDVIHLVATQKQESVLLFYHRGELKQIPMSAFRGLLQSPPETYSAFTAHGVKRLGPEIFPAVFLVTEMRTPTKAELKLAPESHLANRYYRVEAMIRTELFLFDGQNLSTLSDDLPRLHECTRVRRIDGDFPGLLVEDRTLSFSGPFPCDLKTGNSGSRALAFLDTASAAKRLEPVPRFKTSNGRAVHLGDVLGWTKPGVAVIQLSDGFYLLSKSE